MTTLDTLSSQRRPLATRWACGQVLLAAVAARAVRFGDWSPAPALPAGGPRAAAAPALAPGLGIDLAEPLGDRSLLVAAGGGRMTAPGWTVGGAGVVLDGTEWTVERLEPHYGPGSAGRPRRRAGSWSASGSWSTIRTAGRLAAGVAAATGAASQGGGT